MTRVNLDDNRARGLLIDGGLKFTMEVLAVSGAQTLMPGMPYILAYNPANSSQTLTLYTPTIGLEPIKHEIWNIGTGTGALNLLQPDGATSLGSVNPGQKAEVVWNPNSQLWVAFVKSSTIAPQTKAAKLTIQQYTTLPSLANTNVLAIPIPFDFTLNSVGFRTKAPATTAAKLATLTAQVNGVAVTGGVVSLTSANCTPTNTLVAGTTITANGAGTAGQTVGVAVSSVTTFSEGDGYVEYNLTNTDLAA